MPADCKVCTDARVKDINRALDARSINDVAKAFQVPRTTLQRHAAHRAHPDASPAGERAEGRRPCLVCRSPARDHIEAALLDGATAEALEALGHASADTIRRHAQGCMVEALRGARDGYARGLAERARTAIEELLRRARELADDAEAVDEAGHRTATIRERAAALLAFSRAAELLGKATGELGPDIEIRVLELPQWAAIRAAIADALEPYPDAAEAVAVALERLERGAPALPAPEEP